MALAQYTDTFWFPDGRPAAGVRIVVFPQESSVPATLWTDSAGTVPQPNPFHTDDVGGVTFWAETGDYWVHLSAETFPVTIGMSQEQADLSTGIASGGELNINGSDPGSLDIGPVDGYVIDFHSNLPDEPVSVRVKTPARTVALDAAALTRTVTWWLLDSAGNVVQQASKPSASQRRTHLVLGATAQEAGTIFVDQSLPVILHHHPQQTADLMDALGPFVIEGNHITPIAATLGISQSGGSMFARAFNHFAGPVLTNDPHTSTTFAQSPAQYRYITSTGTAFGPTRTTLDVANYDNAGVVTPVGGGANSSTIQRLWLFASNTAAAQLAFQYGQTVHSSLAAAIDAIGQTGYVVNPLILGTGALIAYCVVTRTATDLSDTTQCRIIMANRFATP